MLQINAFYNYRKNDKNCKKALIFFVIFYIIVQCLLLINLQFIKSKGVIDLSKGIIDLSKGVIDFYRIIIENGGLDGNRRQAKTVKNGKATDPGGIG